MTAQEYAKALAICCGADGKGSGEEQVPFPVKHRANRDGGPWTFELSKVHRGLKPVALYQQFKDACTKAYNVYTPLSKAFLIPKDGNWGLPSGWEEEDLHLAMLYNLKQAADARRAAAACVDDDDLGGDAEAPQKEAAATTEPSATSTDEPVDPDEAVFAGQSACMRIHASYIHVPACVCAYMCSCIHMYIHRRIGEGRDSHETRAGYAGRFPRPGADVLPCMGQDG